MIFEVDSIKIYNNDMKYLKILNHNYCWLKHSFPNELEFWSDKRINKHNFFQNMLFQTIDLIIYFENKYYESIYDIEIFKELDDYKYRIKNSYISTTDYIALYSEIESIFNYLHIKLKKDDTDFFNPYSIVEVIETTGRDFNEFI